MKENGDPIYKMAALDLSDYELFLLESFDTRHGIPQSLERLSHEKWVEHVQADLPKTMFSWKQYEAHVNSFYGDGVFFDQDHPLDNP
mgnify:FL=1